MPGKDMDRSSCCADTESGCCSGLEPGLQPIFPDSAANDVCCGAPPAPASSPFAKPGYRLLNYVESFIDTPIGPVPRVKTILGRSDQMGTIAARLGIGRDEYDVAPGIYAVGSPGPDSPVLVTANYKLTFDTLRQELAAFDAWVMVLDTRAINVWCAAGKQLFSTREITHRIKMVGLEKLVRHRRLVLPQLGATGVCAQQVKKDSGFEVVWGPVRAADIQQFISSGNKADAPMRRVTFSTVERLVLIPVELSHLPKPSMWMLLAIFLLSGIGAHFFSFSSAWFRGLLALTAYLSGVLAGAVATPLLLPWLPGKMFAVKGALTGLVAGLAVAIAFRSNISAFEFGALFLITIAVSSFLAMNYTGSSPFTSPSGVEKEMRKAIPFQAGAVLLAAVIWVGAAFAG